MIENNRQLENTRDKLVILQRLYDDARSETEKTYARELTIRSLKHRINRLTEEMARYTAHQASGQSRITT